MQMQELQIKAQEVQRKAAKDQADQAIRQQQLQVERERIGAQQQSEDKRIKANLLRVAAEMNNDKTQNAINIGVDMLKHMSTQNQERQLQEMQARLQAMQNRSKQPKKGDQ